MPESSPPTPAENVTIVGAGHAGVQAADVLRREGFAGRIVLINAEAHLPYQRPPLSKKLLSGELAPERAALKPAAFYEKSAIELRSGVRVEAIDPGDKSLKCVSASGETHSMRYGQLLLCLGSEPRRLEIPGAALAGIHYMRTLDDVNAIRPHCRPGARLIVVGGGYIGLETAATARKLGTEVTVLEAAGRVMSRVAAEQTSAFFEAEHARQGVHIHCNTAVSAFEGDTAVRAVLTADGRRLPADVVVVGAGILPCSTLAQAAGIACDNGIVVDAYGRTNIQDIFAAGDCTHFPSARYGRGVRLESVDNAFEQARAAASTMAGKPLKHDKLPWFWSDQYDLKLMIAGLSTGHDQAVLRGNPDTRAFSVLYLRQGELIAIDAVNSPQDYMAARKLIGEGFRPDPVRLQDTGIPLGA